ncbi:MAG TPA: phosphohistidine phosphatase SixA [Candidatus Binatia bacterium]|nr:phosphohistidine phosphatase SixA [Candidatus Binatia bacterium]
MNLYLMRHGIAVAVDQPGIGSDAERPLTPKGIKRMRRAAQGLRRLKIDFDAILTSPLPRARQTADIVAAALGLEGRLEELTELAPESSLDQLISGLNRFQDKEGLLLVGHNPLLTHAASFLIAGKKQTGFQIDLKKGGLCCIEIDGLPPGAPGTLHWFLTPKQLRGLGD